MHAARRLRAEWSGLPIAAIDSGEAKGEALVIIRDKRKVLRAPSKERVFDPFYQSGPGKRNPEFSLALVYQFVASASGRIEVESTPGEGSAYLLSFPAADGTPVPPDFEETRKAGKKAEHSSVAVAA